jgi:hypothetical protein
MALEIRGIPVLYGDAAERFIKEAEEAEINTHKESLRLSYDELKEMEERGKLFIKQHGGTLKNIQFK